MAEQYFTALPQSAHKKREVELEYKNRRFIIFTDAGVFSRDGLDVGTEILLDTSLDKLSGRVLDLGCGWGACGVIAGKMRPDCQIVMSDINERACELAKENAAANAVSAKVFCGDGLQAVPGNFDWILLNPPIRAGKQTVYELFNQSAHRLNAGGKLAVVIRKQQGALSAQAHLQTLFQTVTLVCRRKGFHVYFCEEVIT